MNLEERLADALRPPGDFRPSPDLFSRLERSLDEDRAFRRRRVAVVAGVSALALTVGGWIAVSVVAGRSGRLLVDGWRLVAAYLVVATVLLVALGPNIRRLGSAFIAEVFHLNPETGARFLAVLDIAYYLAFSGLILVDADVWILDRPVPLLTGLEDMAFRLGVLLAAMGILHALNIALLPGLGILLNSIIRLDRRRRAGPLAPPESPRARSVERWARIAVMTATLLALLPVLVLLVILVIGAGT